MDNKSDTMNIGGPIVTGMALGVLLGILFAPRSGEETRMKLKEIGGKFKEKADETKDQIQEKVGEGIDKAQATTSKLSGKAENAMETARGRLRSRGDNTNESEGV